MRADKVRNQEAVLFAAGRLFDSATDPDQVSMDAVAVAAEVGKGTVFRGFGDRRGLVLALWRVRMAEFDLQNPAVEGGPREQVLDLLDRTWRFKTRHRVLASALEREGVGSPYHGEAYEVWHTEIETHLRAGGVGPEADFLAHALLAAVRSDLVEHLRTHPEVDAQAGLRALVDAVFSRSSQV